MRVKVEQDLCMGHGMCALRAGEVYRLTDLGTNEMGEFEVPVELEQAARRGALACPERVIAIIEGLADGA